MNYFKILYNIAIGRAGGEENLELMPVTNSWDECYQVHDDIHTFDFHIKGDKSSKCVALIVNEKGYELI